MRNVFAVTRLWLLAFFVSLFCVACGPSWTVVAQKTPNPFVNQRVFAVEPMHFEGLVVGEKSEAEYLAGKDAEQQSSWTEDKRALAMMFAEHLTQSLPQVQFVAAAPVAGPYIVRPVITFIEPGFYAGIVAQAAEVRLTLELLSPQGAVLDRVLMTSTVAATLTNPSSGGRLRAAGEGLGAQVAAYMRTRVLPDSD
ncbi:hypothetical protein [Polyangium aurulentum]|uniref:hypothetical protein n=1 Tax=Polyangium aurulentum TaxID=2567896 RepID=UPI0010AE8885|nr:hypothetical protein [Polyangium aurulentum]UQA62404.1 hypothetical protein E8A73_018880 [Polyangium aurulentum]